MTIKSRIEEYTGENFKNNKSIPGSMTYYLENTEKREKSDTLMTDKELMNLQKYLPHCFSKKVYWGKSPKEIVSNDGWEWNDEKEVFSNKIFYDENKNLIEFKGVLKYWNDERYLVPLSKDGIIDKEGIGWVYNNISTCWSLEKKKSIDFWDTRRGKRMSHYIEYRKRREMRANMLKQ